MTNELCTRIGIANFTHVLFNANFTHVFFFRTLHTNQTTEFNTRMKFFKIFTIILLNFGEY